MRYLLDTNTCIAAMRKHARVMVRMQSLSPGDCAVSTITSYELLTGVAKCASPVLERKKIEFLLKLVMEVDFDAAAAQQAACIRADLESRGMTIGPYDLLVAGQAMASGLTLISHNTSEFMRVTGLVVEDWEP